MEKLRGKLSPIGSLTGQLLGAGRISGRLTPLSFWPEYDGPAEITPTGEEQTLQTAGRHLAQDIIISPIPQNYGLITYNGSVITVS